MSMKSPLIAYLLSVLNILLFSGVSDNAMGRTGGTFPLKPKNWQK